MAPSSAAAEIPGCPQGPRPEGAGHRRGGGGGREEAPSRVPTSRLCAAGLVVLSAMAVAAVEGMAAVDGGAMSSAWHLDALYADAASFMQTHGGTHVLGRRPAAQAPETDLRLRSNATPAPDNATSRASEAPRQPSARGPAGTPPAAAALAGPDASAPARASSNVSAPGPDLPQRRHVEGAAAGAAAGDAAAEAVAKEVDLLALQREVARLEKAHVEARIEINLGDVLWLVIVVVLIILIISMISFIYHQHQLHAHHERTAGQRLDGAADRVRAEAHHLRDQAGAAASHLKEDARHLRDDAGAGARRMNSRFHDDGPGKPCC